MPNPPASVSTIAAEIVAADVAAGPAVDRPGKKGGVQTWAQPLPNPRLRTPGRPRPWAALLGAVMIALLGLGAGTLVLVNRGGESTSPPGASPGEPPVRSLDTSTPTATATPSPPDSAEPSASPSETAPPRTGSAVPPVITSVASSPSASPSSPASGSSPTSTPTPTPTPTVPPSPSPSPSPTGPLNTGTYRGTVTVLADPFGHAPFIGPMPTVLDVLFTRGVTTGTVTITITGARPWIEVRGTGNYNANTGAFTATGNGQVTANQIPVTAAFVGTLKDGALAGTLTFTGTPNGPISYRVQMTKQ